MGDTVEEENDCAVIDIDISDEDVSEDGKIDVPGDVVEEGGDCVVIDIDSSDEDVPEGSPEGLRDGRDEEESD